VQSQEANPAIGQVWKSKRHKEDDEIEEGEN